MNERTELALQVLMAPFGASAVSALSQLMEEMAGHTRLSPRLRAEICAFINEVRTAEGGDLHAYYNSLPRRSSDAALRLLRGGSDSVAAGGVWLAQGRAVALDFGATQPGEVVPVFMDELTAIHGVVSDTARQHGLGRAMLLAAVIELASVEKFHWDTFINFDPAL